jgi:hypothetical protein
VIICNVGSTQYGEPNRTGGKSDIVERDGSHGVGTDTNAGTDNVEMESRKGARVGVDAIGNHDL